MYNMFLDTVTTTEFVSGEMGFFDGKNVKFGEVG
jgi:hypothetical protein